MNGGIVLFATDDESIIRDVESKIAASKNKCNVIKDTSKIVIEHLLKMIDNNISEEKKFDSEFEKGFCNVYFENISSEINELSVHNLLDEMIGNLIVYNKNFEIEKDITLSDNYKIKINKSLFNSFLKYILNFSINSNDSYKMKINGGVNYVVNKEVTNIIINIADKTNEKTSFNSSISKLTPERIDFINLFMNQLLEPCSCKFRINKIDAKFTIELHLIKKVEK